jgi:hypothetical protein
MTHMPLEDTYIYIYIYKMSFYNIYVCISHPQVRLIAFQLPCNLLRLARRLTNSRQQQPRGNGLPHTTTSRLFLAMISAFLRSMRAPVNATLGIDIGLGARFLP